jgi:hypothetical protein
VRKVACLVGYYGGLRNVELRSIEFGKIFENGESSFEVDEAGYWFNFERAKQRGMTETSTFCVPRRQADWDPPVASPDRNPVDYDPASVIDEYLNTLQSDLELPHEKLTGAFFKSAHGKTAKRFRNFPMGKNLLAKTGIEFAVELALPNPHRFTSHCWRRSCGTNASDAGVNVTTLMAQLGWATPKTAIGYVKKSRMTSFQMSMFLSNVQRQNKDLDSVLGRVKSSSSRNSVTPKKSGSSSASASSKRQQTVVASRDFDSNLASTFSVGLAAARNSESVGRTREEQEATIERANVLSNINCLPQIAPVSRLSSVRLVSSDQHGGGGGEESSEVVGGSGGEEFRTVGHGDGSVQNLVDMSSVDPRVSTILSNLRNHGELHVHFHFGGH